VPNLKEQKKIGNILRSLDDKIKLNDSITSALEKLQETLFKRWFIDFEFPDDGGNPYKSNNGEMKKTLVGEIPKDWSFGNLIDMLSLLKDGTHNPPKRVSEGIRFLAGASNIKHFDINFEKCTYITIDDYNKIHRKWKVKANDILLTIVGTIGNVAIVQEEDLPFSLQRSIAVLRANEKSSYLFLYFLLSSDQFKQYVDSRINPTAQPGIYLGTLSKFKTIIPPKNVINKFCKKTEPLILLMHKNNVESRVLSSLRDVLLPRFMSGEIRVPVEED